MQTLKVTLTHLSTLDDNYSFLLADDPLVSDRRLNGIKATLASKLGLKPKQTFVTPDTAKTDDPDVDKTDMMQPST